MNYEPTNLIFQSRFFLGIHGIPELIVDSFLFQEVIELNICGLLKLK